MALLDSRDPDRAYLGGSADVYDQQWSRLMEYKFEVGKEYKTRGGLVATILDVNYKGGGGYSIVGKIHKDGCEQVMAWRSDGSFISLKYKHPCDLMPPVEAKEIWVNVYAVGSPGIWHDRWLADEHAADTRIGLLKITITDDDFEVEKVAI